VLDGTAWFQGEGQLPFATNSGFLPPPRLGLRPYGGAEVRPPFNPRTTLCNTDGQVFSDAGIPVVLFMEYYDINGLEYNDMHDTMENIDPDYGAAFAAIAIESVARAAAEPPPA
jgi:hypothetical protein